MGAQKMALYSLFKLTVLCALFQAVAAFGPLPEPAASVPPPPSSPAAVAKACDYSTHDYMLVGTEMTCVARNPDPSDFLWYDLEHGKCTVTSANETHVIFEIAVDSAVLFTSVPYQRVLNPSQTEELSNMSHYDGKAVILSYDVGGQMHLYAGKGSVRADGKGQLVGERLAGANHQALGAPVDCVLEEVESVKGASAVSMGQCTFSGDGRVDATLQAPHGFTGAGVLFPATATTRWSLFKGVNAAVYAKNGTYEVFTITQMNETHVSGLTYFSTRLQTWETDFSTGEKLVEECSLFVDYEILEFGDDGECDCDYHPGGCSISTAAPKGKACKCSMAGPYTCGGDVVNCVGDESSAHCLAPDTGYVSCMMGGGDCDGYPCDCDYHQPRLKRDVPGGCLISKAAPEGKACKCSMAGPWTCGGDVVNCVGDKSSALCVAPDKSFVSCTMGGGDCLGYGWSCDCDYHPGGCSISPVRAAPKGTACKCSMAGPLTCGGDVVPCVGDESSALCVMPDESVASCVMGGGDCDGYEDKKCDCDYHSGGVFSSGGCHISKAAPKYTACKCSMAGPWTCGGNVVRCKTDDDALCVNPDKSKNSCKLAAGSDCDGY